MANDRITATHYSTREMTPQLPGRDPKDTWEGQYDAGESLGSTGNIGAVLGWELNDGNPLSAAEGGRHHAQLEGWVQTMDTPPSTHE